MGEARWEPTEARESQTEQVCDCAFPASVIQFDGRTKCESPNLGNVSYSGTIQPRTQGWSNQSAKRGPGAGQEVHTISIITAGRNVSVIAASPVARFGH